MISIDEAHTILDEIAQELPEEFWQELNGGVALLPAAKRSPAARADDLYILGEYCVSHTLGRYINIYYGSFTRLFGDIPRQTLKKKLRKTLFHEFTHHVESLAGERGLEIKDAEQLARYFREHDSP